MSSIAALIARWTPQELESIFGDGAEILLFRRDCEPGGVFYEQTVRRYDNRSVAEELWHANIRSLTAHNRPLTLTFRAPSRDEQVDAVRTSRIQAFQEWRSFKASANTSAWVEDASVRYSIEANDDVMLRLAEVVQRTENGIDTSGIAIRARVSEGGQILILNGWGAAGVPEAAGLARGSSGRTRLGHLFIVF